MSSQKGRDIRRVLQYQGGAPMYRARCEEIAEKDYEGFVLE